jgi:hypothetical protein
MLIRIGSVSICRQHLDNAIDVPCRSKYRIEHALIHDDCHDHLKFETSRGGSVGWSIDVFVTRANTTRLRSLLLMACTLLGYNQRKEAE